MPSLIRRLTSPPQAQERQQLPLQEWINFLSFQQGGYPTGWWQTLQGDREKIGGDFTSLVSGAYAANGVVFACMLTRLLHFSEARFQFRQMRNGRPGNLFGTPALRVLEQPWPNGTTGDLLARMIQDVDLAGNAFILRQGNRLVRLRPDWTNILHGSTTDREDWVPGDPDTELIGYVYQPGGLRSGKPEIVYRASQVAHFAPIPDPQATYRGMTWLTPLIREVQADNAMSSHRLKFFENGATVNLVVKLPKEAAPTMEQFQEWVSVIRQGHEGPRNAYRTLFLGMGADVTAVGSDLQQNDFRAVQTLGETRIAMAARVPPTILGNSEGLSGSTLNAGNYQESRRNFADGCLRPLWRNAAGSLATLVIAPNGAELWYDDRDIAFLKEDVLDTANVQQIQAATISSYVSSGYTPDSAVAAVVANDITLLQHSGLASVQLQPIGSVNGDGNGNGSNPTASPSLTA